MVCAALLACTSAPQRGGDPVRRDSIGDPIKPIDSTERLDPDSVADTPKVRF